MLFNNVGKSLCSISKILFFISGIGAILCIILAVEYYSVGVLIFGIVLCINELSISLFLYGFAQLILNIQEINERINKIYKAGIGL